MKDSQVHEVTFSSEFILPSDHPRYISLKLSWVAAAVSVVLNILANGVVRQYLHGEVVVYESLLLGLLVVLGATATYILGWTALYRLHRGRFIAYRILGGSMVIVYFCMSVLPYGPCNGWLGFEEYLEYDDPRAYFGLSATTMENLTSTCNGLLQSRLLFKLRVT